jgi:hypothetical protein
MSLLNQFQQQFQDAQAAGNVADMNETTTGGGGGGRTLPAGKAIAVLTGYIESGLQPREFNGKPKPPTREMKLIFTIMGGRGKNVNGEVEDYVLEEGNYPTIGTFFISVTNNEKSKAVKWFQRMRQNCYGDGGEVSFAQFLGKAFLLPITHTVSKKDGKDVVYANIDPATVDKPEDPMTVQPYAIPAVPDDVYKLLLWDAPTKEQWDSLYIETPDDAEKSRNYLQEHLMTSLDFGTSKLAALLGVGDADAAQKVAVIAAQSAIPDPDAE